MIKVVIGANFGDEGKGLITDYLASQSKNGIVVRFNGGSQAGHTVVTPEGKRHVFGHIGSGALCGLSTYLDKHFIINPLVFNKEFRQFTEHSASPVIHANGSCMVTTPYDIGINRIAEIHRSGNRHGSCGLGINETVTRHEAGLKLTLSDLQDEDYVRSFMHIMRKSYVPYRLNQLEIPRSSDYHRLIADFSNQFVKDIKSMLIHVTISDDNIIRKFEDVIFEGAQGLMLDMNYHYFPHVTRSNTGLKNIAEFLKDNCEWTMNEDLDIIYVTRCYFTRHGAGPFPTEMENMSGFNVVDKTNIPNDFQHSLRLGLLSIDSLCNNIVSDLTNLVHLDRHVKSTDVKLAITCLDQVKSVVGKDNDRIIYFSSNGKQIGMLEQDFIDTVFRSTGIHQGYLSYGETRSTIKEYSLTLLEE